MNTSIYISGICKDENNAQETRMVKSITKKLKSEGFNIVNPNELAFSQVSWTDTMINRLDEMGQCEIIYMLPRWREDIMSRIELTAAMNQRLYTLFHPVSSEQLKSLQTALDV